jgi:hypothetical protein
MVEDWRVVHFVLQNCDSLVLLRIDLAQELQSLSVLQAKFWLCWVELGRAFHYEITMGAHMARPLVLLLVLEDALCRRFVVIVVSLQSRCHAEIIHEERVLVYVLKDTELSLTYGELPAILKEVMRVQTLFLIVFLDAHWLNGYLLTCVQTLLNVRSVEMSQVLIFPVKLVE